MNNAITQDDQIKIIEDDGAEHLFADAEAFADWFLGRMSPTEQANYVGTTADQLLFDERHYSTANFKFVYE